MTEEVLDTNIILRYLVRDNELLYKKSTKIFEEAINSERNLAVKTVVVAEVCFVLESVYKKRQEEIAKALEKFLAQEWLNVEDRPVMLYLWKFYLKNMHFVDSYLLACASVNKSKIVSFDRKLLNKLK